MVKNIFKNLMVTLSGLALLFAAGEAFVRVFDKYKAFNEIDLPKYRKYDMVFHHLFVPDSKGRYSEKEYKTVYVINSMGLRDREYNPQKPDFAYRIIVMGDSFVEGRGVNIEDTFVKRLEGLLNENNRHGELLDYEVLNAGISSYSPILEYQLLRKKLINLEPDALVLCLDLSDIQDDHIYAKGANFNKKGELEAVSPPLEALNGPKKVFLTRFFERHSPFYLYARRKLLKLFKIGSYHASRKHMQETRINFGEIETDRLFMLRDDANIEPYWEFTASYILKMKKLLEDKGVKFILLTYAYGHQVDKDEWSEGRQSWGFKKDVLYDNDRIFYLIRDFCRRFDINLIETHEDLRKVDRHPLYYKYDGHFTALGNQVMAEIIYNKLTAFLQR